MNTDESVKVSAQVMKTADAVYFSHDDYAPFWLRLLIDAIDLLAIGAAWSLVAVVLFKAFPFNRMTLNLTLVSFAVVAFCYLVILKRSKIGTLAYRVGGVRIVGLDGQTASLSALSYRMLFAPLGPIFWFLDWGWISGDNHRQALRDKLAHTYVIRAKAEPVGTAKIILQHYDIFGFNFLFQEIEAPTTTEADAATGSAN